MSGKHHNHTLWWSRVGRLLVLSFACVMLAGMQAEKPEANRPPAPSETPTHHAPDTNRMDSVVTIGTLLLVGVIGVGFALIALTILWGNRTRREAKKPLPPQTTQDELWFLRAKSESKNDSTESDSEEKFE